MENIEKYEYYKYFLVKVLDKVDKNFSKLTEDYINKKYLFKGVKNESFNI